MSEHHDIHAGPEPGRCPSGSSIGPSVQSPAQSQADADSRIGAEAKFRPRSGTQFTVRGKDRRPIRGFTLLELLVTVTVLSLLLTLGVPSLQSMLARSRLQAAAQALADDLQWARSESIKQNTELHLSFDATTWCYGVDEAPGCDCRLTDPSAGSACALTLGGMPDGRSLKVTLGEGFPGIRMSTSLSGTSFEPRRGTARNGTIRFQTAGGSGLHVVLSRLGRVRVCYPADGRPVPGHRPC